MMKQALMSSLVALAACQSAVNLDVQYTDAGSTVTAPPTPSTPVDAGPVDSATPVDPPVLGDELQGCPCDVTQGLACCVSTAGPFCTTDQARCDGENGGFYRCFGPDLSTESVCCLRVHGTTAQTSLAAVCPAGVATVCRVDEDCPNRDCERTTCAGGMELGTCGAAPDCPR